MEQPDSVEMEREPKSCHLYREQKVWLLPQPELTTLRAPGCATLHIRAVCGSDRVGIGFNA